MQYTLVVVGNPVDGFKYIGPFDTYDEALKYADNKMEHDKDWWLVPVTAP